MATSCMVGVARRQRGCRGRSPWPSSQSARRAKRVKGTSVYAGLWSKK